MKAKLPLILSLVAVVVAVLGATPVGHAAKALVVPASSVGTVQLKANAVVSAKVKNGSLLAADFKRGQLPAGPTGPAGAPGAAGAAGAPGVSGLEVVTASTVNNNVPGTKSVTVSCPAGKKAIAGGGEIQSSPAYHLYVSKPLADLSGWTASGSSDSAGFWGVVVYAVCGVVT